LRQAKIYKITEMGLKNITAGGWAGKMIGIPFGGPMEFR
jgi:hypothetical protein